MEPVRRLVAKRRVRLWSRELNEMRSESVEIFRQEEAQGVRGMKFPEVFFFEEEQNLSKRGTIVNEWEKLNRISNRRLNVQNLNTPLKLQWSIDRILCRSGFLSFGV